MQTRVVGMGWLSPKKREPTLCYQSAWQVGQCLQSLWLAGALLLLARYAPAHLEVTRGLANLDNQRLSA